MNRQRELSQISQLLILCSYTALVVGLVTEILLMDWEIWAIPLILGGVVAGWFVHFRQRMDEHQRLWVYTFLMMGTLFFYGIHITSTFDMALLTMIVMIIFTVAGERKLITFCQIIYYVVLIYDLIGMNSNGVEWNMLLISRIVLHFVMVLLAGWLARFIIRGWEKMLRDNDLQIEQLNESIKCSNGFMGNLSHELRTPVNAIAGMTEVMLEEEDRLQAKIKLQSILAATNRLTVRVCDIMDYSELETKRLVVNNGHYTLASLMNDVVNELQPLMSREIELVINAEATIPEELISDFRKLHRILYHVIGNSLKFTKEGGVYVHITSNKRSYGINLCVEVIDTGVGMSEVEIESVLRHFYQTDSGKTVTSGGLGLGLPIANGFVHSLGGFMSIESKLDIGTTVRISIPHRVAGEQNCMSVANKEQINMGGFLNIRKFSNPQVRDFYNRTIFDIVQGIGIPMHRVDNVEDLKKLIEKMRLTHLFVGVEEYKSAQTYLEKLTERINVIVVARPDFVLPESSGAFIIPKPLSGFSIVNVLNTKHLHEDEQNKRLRCLDVHALVVDDEPMNLNVASSILHKYGMEITTAVSGQEAVMLCRKMLFDVVFMDHMMPDMDGVEAMHKIRMQSVDRNVETPIIALTANALSSAREMFLSEGFDGFVSKPIEITELERVLKRVLPEKKIVYEPVTCSGNAEKMKREIIGKVAHGEVSIFEIDRTFAENDAVKIFGELSAAGLETEKGRNYCQDDQLYFSLLREFADKYSRKRQLLEEYCTVGDCTNYAILVHALKSTAKMIGATAFSEQARQMEAEAKASNMSYILEQHERLMDSYQVLVLSIRSILGEQAASNTPDALTDECLEFFPEEGTDK